MLTFTNHSYGLNFAVNSVTQNVDGSVYVIKHNAAMRNKDSILDVDVVVVVVDNKTARSKC